MEIKKTISGIKNIPFKLGKSAKEGIQTIESLKYQKQAKCLLIHKNVAMITDCIISPDNFWVVPKGFNLKFRYKHHIILKPDNTLFFLCNIDNPQTWSPDEPPAYDIVEEEVIDKVIKDGKEIEVYNYKEQEVYGGHILSKVAFDVGRTSILRFMEGKSKKEIILIFLVSLFLGIIIGAVLGGLALILFMTVIT